MLKTFQELITNQFEASFCTLNVCIDRCPEEAWDAPVANLRFCQVVFHTLFYADYYLGTNEESLRKQAFHSDNQQVFRDYEELQDRKQQFLYDRSFAKQYLAHCRGKATQTIFQESTETLSGPSGFARRDFSRAELHVYNVRHFQHHVAQLSLRLRIDGDVDIPWVGSGWRDV